MARNTTQVRYYANINLSRDYSNVCDNIDLNTLNPYIRFTDYDISVIKTNITNGEFKVNRSIAELIDINYIAMINNSGTQRVLYAFIDDLEFIAEDVTNIKFTIDLFTSYCNSIDYQDTFIKRMTTSDDTMYKYLEDEPINGGDYVTNPNHIFRNYVESWKYGYTSATNSDGGQVNAELKDNVLSMAKFHGGSNYGELMVALYLFNSHGYIDNVIDVFQYPSECGDNGEHVREENAMAFPNSIDGYIPKNKKLFNYPYVRGLAVSSSGDTLEIKPEKCQNNEIAFHIDKIVQPINQMVYTLTNYDRLSYNDDKLNRMVLSGFPQVIWSSDNYRAWLARNKPSKDLAKEQIVANVAGTAGTLAIGAMTGGVGLAVAGPTAISMGVNTMMSAEKIKADNESAKMLPHTIHRGGDLGVDVTNNKFGFVTFIQTIDARRASLIDNYFNAYGYAINKVSYFRPNRIRFDYVETVGELFRRRENGHGCPNIAIDTINRVANNGLRIWHSIGELNRHDLVSLNSIR